jgi:hypothetical protein
LIFIKKYVIIYIMNKERIYKKYEMWF